MITRNKIGIIHYNSGNVGSLIKTVKKFSSDVIIVKNILDFNKCNKVILPGVGSFDIAIDFLKKKKLLNKLKRFILDGGDALGICLGMQILYKSSEESKFSKGTGLIKKKIQKIKFENNVTVPHIGWNKIFINDCRENEFYKIIKNKKFYFSHSYADKILKNKKNKAYFSYGKYHYNAIIEYKNLLGLQFHPELSGKSGIKIFDLFINRKSS